MIQGTLEKHFCEVQAYGLLADAEAHPARVVAIIVRKRSLQKVQDPLLPHDLQLHA